MEKDKDLDKVWGNEHVPSAVCLNFAQKLIRQGGGQLSLLA